MYLVNLELMVGNTIVGGLSLNEAEQRIAPLLTSLLCVLHILLYFLIKCLEEFP